MPWNQVGRVQTSNGGAWQVDDTYVQALWVICLKSAGVLDIDSAWWTSLRNQKLSHHMAFCMQLLRTCSDCRCCLPGCMHNHRCHLQIRSAAHAMLRSNRELGPRHPVWARTWQQPTAHSTLAGMTLKLLTEVQKKSLGWRRVWPLHALRASGCNPTEGHLDMTFKNLQILLHWHSASLSNRLLSTSMVISRIKDGSVPKAKFVNEQTSR